MPHKDPDVRRAYQATHRRAHKEEYAQRDRLRYQTYKEGRRVVDKRLYDAKREIRLEQMRAYYKSHKEQWEAYKKAWQQANPDQFKISRMQRVQRYQVLKRNAYTESVSFQAIMERDRMMCGICHKRVARKALSFDHIIPLSWGGAHVGTNLQVAHRFCNASRGAGRLPAQMRLAI